MNKLTKTSKVTSITGAGNFRGQKGLIHKFTIEFENGDKGEFTTNKNPQTKFVEGETVQYTVEEQEIQTSRGPWKKIKIDKVKEEGGRNYYNPDPMKQLRIIKSVSLTAAIKYKRFTGTEEKLIVIANTFKDYILSKGDDEAKTISAQTAIKDMVLSIELFSVDKQDPKTIEEHLKTMADPYINFILSE